MVKEESEQYMQQCLQLARTALESGNPPVGALIVVDDQVIGTGIESGRSTGDITNHAEIMAIRDAINNGYADLLDRACLFTTHEPCIMCSYVIRHHRIAEIVYGVSVLYVGGLTSSLSVLTTTDVPKWGQHPKITGGIFADACHELNEQFRKTLD